MLMMIITVPSCLEPGEPAPCLWMLWAVRCTGSGCVSLMKSHSSTRSNTPSSYRWAWRPNSPGRWSRALTGRWRRTWRATLPRSSWLRGTRWRLSAWPLRVSRWCSSTGSTTEWASPARPTWASRGLAGSTRWANTQSVSQVSYNSQLQLIQNPNLLTEKIPSLPIKVLLVNICNL